MQLGTVPEAEALVSKTKKPAQTREKPGTLRVDFFTAMTHFSSQRILGRVVRSQVG